MEENFEDRFLEMQKSLYPQPITALDKKIISPETFSILLIMFGPPFVPSFNSKCTDVREVVNRERMISSRSINGDVCF